MGRTTQAVVLARGLGTRMRRATDTALDAEQSRAADAGLKAMMPVGRPFLDHLLSRLADGGITDVVLVIGPEHAAVREYFTVTAPPRRVRVTFAIQIAPRGTADALLAAEGVVQPAPFLVTNADNLYPADAIAKLAEAGGNALVAFDADALVREGNIPVDRVLKFALLDIDDDGYLRAVHEKPSADDPLARRADRWVSMNLWSFTPAIFAACRRVTPSARGELELTDAIALAMREDGARFLVVPVHAGVLDLSERGDVAAVTARLAGARVDP
jgi:dTDP-glucose pyrophosphorylase